MPVFEQFTVKRGPPLTPVRKQVQRFDPTRGFFNQYEFESLSQPAIAAVANDYASQGCLTELVLEDDKGTLTVEDPTLQFNIDIWEIDGNELDVDGLSHPSITTIFNDNEIAIVRAGIDNADASTGTGVNGIVDGILADLGTYDGSQNPAILHTDLQIDRLRGFIGLNFRGSSNFLRSQYVLRHTVNIPNRNFPTLITSNALTIYPGYAAMISEISSQFFTYPCPIPMQNVLIAATTDLQNYFLDTGAAADANYTLGWLKKPSTWTQTGYNRLDVRTEYVLDLWSNLYYLVDGLFPLA